MLKEAEKSLRFYRNISDDDIAESGAMLKSELQEMHKIYVPENKNRIETAKPTLATDLSKYIQRFWKPHLSKLK